MYYTLAEPQLAALGQNVELMLVAGGYAGLQPVQADQAVLCMLLPIGRLRAAGGQWARVLNSLMHECPHLRERLSGASALLERPLAVAGLPYGYRHAAGRSDLPGLFRLGDQAAVIASLTGDGVALALGSGMLAARSWHTGGYSACYHRHLAARLAGQMRIASAVHRACLAPRLQPWLVGAARRWPGLMRKLASATRLTEMSCRPR